MKKVPSGAAVIRPELTDALLRAFFEEWAARGYTALSLESVAKRAGAGKAALYRRWSSKAAMARDALNLVGVDLTVKHDAGSLRADIRALLVAIRRALRHPLIKRIVPDLNAELSRSDDLASIVRPFQRARRAHGEALLRRAIGRGELQPELDIELGNDLLGAPLYWRVAVVSGRADEAYLDRLTAAIEGGLRTL